MTGANAADFFAYMRGFVEWCMASISSTKNIVEQLITNGSIALRLNHERGESNLVFIHLTQLTDDSWYVSQYEDKHGLKKPVEGFTIKGKNLREKLTNYIDTRHATISHVDNPTQTSDQPQRIDATIAEGVEQGWIQYRDDVIIVHRVMEGRDNTIQLTGIHRDTLLRTYIQAMHALLETDSTLSEQATKALVTYLAVSPALLQGLRAAVDIAAPQAANQAMQESHNNDNFAHVLDEGTNLQAPLLYDNHPASDLSPFSLASLALCPLGMYLLTPSLSAPVQTLISLSTVLSLLPLSVAQDDSQPGEQPTRQPGAHVENITPSSAPINTSDTLISLLDENFASLDNYAARRQLQVASAIGSEFQINTDTAGDSSPVVAALTGGGFVVTWFDHASPAKIHGQLYSATASAIGAEFQINTDTAGGEYQAVAALPGGGFVVTWNDNASPQNIHGQVYSATASAIGSEFQINTDTAGDYYPTVAALTGGGFVVTWQSYSSPSKIHGQLYSATASAIGSEFQINTDTAGDKLPTVAALTGGGFVVTWGDYASPQNIHGQLYSATASAIGSEFKINTDTAGDNYPTVAALTGGGFVVTWFTNTYLIQGQLYSATASAIGSEFKINTDTAGDNYHTVAALPGGGFVVTWSDISSPANIHGQLYSATASAIGAEFQINTDTAGDCYPTVAALPGGGFVVTWFDNASPGNIHGQLFNINASPTSQPSNLPSSQPSEQPTSEPSAQPSEQPTRQPNSHPSDQPTRQPSTQPSKQPTNQPSAQPTKQPTDKPSAQPSDQLTRQPRAQPSTQPSGQPTGQPSTQPSGQPTSQPSDLPSGQPTGQPSTQPSGQPTGQPCTQPIGQPTGQPSTQPSGTPTGQPSTQPSRQPTDQPSTQPNGQPTNQPSAQPSEQPTGQPSIQPSEQPTGQPSIQPSGQPTGQPSTQPSGQPTGQPSDLPSGQPTSQPSTQPRGQPTGQPSTQPSGQSTGQPSTQPSEQPTGQPSIQPSEQPTDQPSAQPSGQPTGQPSTQPSEQPTGQPSTQPSGQPTRQPSARPSSQPSFAPSRQPTTQPTGRPTTQPSRKPSTQPTTHPSRQPGNRPTTHPSRQPSSQPTTQPSRQPDNRPTTQPSRQPSSRPTNIPSYSQAPTALTARNWSAQITETSFINDVVVLNGKTIVCGGIIPAICLQFDNPTGQLSAAYAFPWDQNNAVTVVNDDLVLAGQWNGGQKYEIARFSVSSKQLVWGFSISSNYAKYQAVTFNQAMQQIIAAGYDDDGNAVANAINKDTGELLWGYTYQIAELATYITDVDALPQLAGSCMTGYVIDESANYKISMVIMMINNIGSLSTVNTLMNGNIETQANCVTIDSVSSDAIVAGTTYQSKTNSMNALITRIHNDYTTSSVSWAIEFNSKKNSQFTDVLINNNTVFALGYSAGFSPETNKINMIVLQLDASNGNTINAVRISGPDNILCYSLAHIENGLIIACNNANAQATLVFLDENTLAPGKLPPGYTWYDDILSVLVPVSNNLMITNIPLSRLSVTKSWSSSFLQSPGNQVVASPSFTQSWPENLPSMRPTAAPATLPPTQWPSGYPSSNPSMKPSSTPTRRPSGRPTSVPSNSFHPTGNPSSSVPTITDKPMSAPTYKPSVKPSVKPTVKPSVGPSKNPTLSPTIKPSYLLTNRPSLIKSKAPTYNTSYSPSRAPSQKPSVLPILAPSNAIMPDPTSAPTTRSPTQPSSVLSVKPTFFQHSKKTKMSQTDSTLLIVFGCLGGGVLLYVGKKYVVTCSLNDIFYKKIIPVVDIENQTNNQTPDVVPSEANLDINATKTGTPDTDISGLSVSPDNHDSVLVDSAFDKDWQDIMDEFEHDIENQITRHVSNQDTPQKNLSLDGPKLLTKKADSDHSSNNFSVSSPSVSDYSESNDLVGNDAGSQMNQPVSTEDIHQKPSSSTSQKLLQYYSIRFHNEKPKDNDVGEKGVDSTHGKGNALL